MIDYILINANLDKVLFLVNYINQEQPPSLAFARMPRAEARGASLHNVRGIMVCSLESAQGNF